MDFLFSPWRYTYVSSSSLKTGRCIFCIGESPGRDAENLVVYRAGSNFIIMNRYPYTSGHLMIAPYAHVGRITDTDPEQVAEMSGLCRRAVEALEAVYRPDGFNIGMNLGHAAGAGVRDHLHLHVVPRWSGDVNFMTTTGETRVLPEDLETTYGKLKDAFSIG